MYGDLGISKEVLEYGARIEAALEDRFTEIDGNAEYDRKTEYEGICQKYVPTIEKKGARDIIGST